MVAFCRGAYHRHFKKLMGTCKMVHSFPAPLCNFSDCLSPCSWLSPTFAHHPGVLSDPWVDAKLNLRLVLIALFATLSFPLSRPLWCTLSACSYTLLPRRRCRNSCTQAQKSSRQAITFIQAMSKVQEESRWLVIRRWKTDDEL